MNNNDSLGFKDSLLLTYQELTAQIIAFSPKLIGAILLLLIGWVLAIFLRMVTKKLVIGLDSLFKRLVKSGGIRQESLKRSYAKVASQIVFWIIILFFLAATANLLGWRMFSNWMSGVITYLPNLISGLLIILAGFIVSNISKAAIVNTANNAGLEQGDMLARIAQMIILFTVLVVGIEQIGINVDFLTNVLIVIVGVLLAGGTLAFSFGAKNLVANIIGAQYVRKHCRIGEIMAMEDFEGSIIEVTQTSIILETEAGRTVVPAKFFQEKMSRFASPVRNVGAAASSSSPKGE